MLTYSARPPMALASQGSSVNTLTIPRPPLRGGQTRHGDFAGKGSQRATFCLSATGAGAGPGLMTRQAHTQTGGQPPMLTGDIATATAIGLPTGRGYLSARI